MKPESIQELAKNDVFEAIILFGKYCLFTGHRIERGSVPEGLFVYDIRHCDDDWGEPCEILPHVLVNYLGSIVTTERFPIDFSKSYCDIHYDAGDFEYLENVEDEDLWDDYDNIPGDLEGYINYPNDTGWDIPVDRVYDRNKEVEATVYDTINDMIHDVEKED